MHNHGYSSLPSNIKYPAAIYWNVLECIGSNLFMTWGHNIGYYLIFGGIHILLTILGFYFVWCCVCCLLSIGIGTQHQQKKTMKYVSGDWTGGDSDVSVGRCYLALVQFTLVPQTKNKGITQHQSRTGCSGCWPAKSEPCPTSLGALEEPAGLRDSFCFLSGRPRSEAKQKVPCPWRSHASSMPPMCPRSRGAGAPASSERSTSCSLWAPRRSSDVRVLLPPIWIYLPTGLRWEKNKQVSPQFFAIFHMEVFHETFLHCRDLRHFCDLRLSTALRHAHNEPYMLLGPRRTTCSSIFDLDIRRVDHWPCFFIVGDGEPLKHSPIGVHHSKYCNHPKNKNKVTSCKKSDQLLFYLFGWFYMDPNDYSFKLIKDETVKWTYTGMFGQKSPILKEPQFQRGKNDLYQSNLYP